MISGCPKKTVVQEGPSFKGSEQSEGANKKDIIEQEKANEEKMKSSEVREASKTAEEETKREDAKKEFEKSLTALRAPGNEGEILESKMLKDVYFDYDKYDIRLGDAEILKDNAALLMKNSPLKFQVEGHCDERGTNEYNLALGERRANSVKNYLISLGIEASRIVTISYGEEKPVDPSHNDAAWANNRRAHILILSK
jgi:peptidoglycan-associated lipoprotein